MPIYAIAREYKLPVYRHLIVEAPDFATACRKAVEHDDWQSSNEDYDGCGPTYLTAAVCVPERRADEDPGNLLYSDLPALDIPAEFADENEQKSPPAEGAAATVHVLAIAHQLGGNPFRATTRFITSAHRSEAGAHAALAAFCRQHWMDLFDDEEDADIPADEAETIRKFFAAAEGQASWELLQAPIDP